MSHLRLLLDLFVDHKESCMLFRKSGENPQISVYIR